MRRAARVDGNQSSIVAALRSVGASVEPLHMVGRGVPDLVVGFRGENYLLEVKDSAQAPSKRRLTEDEVRWHEKWRGRAAIVEDVDSALRAIGALQVA